MLRRLVDFLNEWYMNIVLIFLSTSLLIQSADYPETARAFPRLILIFTLLLVFMDSIYKILEFRKREGANNQKANKTDDKDIYEQKAKIFTENFSSKHLYVLYAILLMFVFLIFIHLVGFIFGSFIFLILASWLLGYKNLKHLFISSIAITCFIYLIFIVIMKSILPQGLMIEYLLR